MSTLPPGPQSGWSPPPASGPGAQAGPPAPAAGPPPGRGLVIAGSVLIAVAVLGGFIGVQVSVSRLDVASLQRDVVVDGPRQVIVPGRIPFQVQEPISSGTRSAMTVGIGVDSRSGPTPTCTLTTADGGTVGGQPVFGTELIDQRSSRFEVAVAARLDPGDYVAECRGPSEGAVLDSEFTVGRVLGQEDVSGLVGPALTALGVGALAVLLLVVGVILLIVGLVRRNRGDRSQPPPGWPQGGPQQWAGPPQAGQQWGGGQWAGPPYGGQQWGGGQWGGPPGPPAQGGGWGGPPPGATPHQPGPQPPSGGQPPTPGAPLPPPGGPPPPPSGPPLR